jgi:hypothetical protein
MADKLTAVGRLLHGQHSNKPISLPISREKYDDPTFIPRLSFRASARIATDFEAVTRAVALHHGYALFIDTNLVNVADAWWEAILSAPGRVHVTGRVLRELVPIFQRRTTHPLRRAIRERDPAIVLCADPADQAMNRVFWYYVFLLAARRLHIHMAVKHFYEEHGREPTSQELTALKNQFQSWAGDRALRMNLKPISPIRTDEALVVVAIMHAVRTGQPTKIVSADLDVEEQFYLMIRLLTMHYFEMLLSRAYADDFASFRPKPISPDTMQRYARIFDERHAVAIDLQQRGIHDFLPSAFDFVPVTSWTLGDTYSSEVAYGAETAMSATLSMKAATNGLSTDRLGGRCAHPWFLPEDIADLGPGRALVAYDETAFVMPQGMAVSHFDLMSTYWPGDPHASVAEPPRSALVIPSRRRRRSPAPKR